MHASVSSAPSAPGLLQASATICPECSTPLETTDDERFCPKCGLVVEDAPPVQVEIRVTRPTTPIPRAMLPETARTRALRHARDAPRSLSRARAILNRLASQLSLPNYVAIDAFHHFKRLRAKRATQGRRLDATCAACLLEAARDRGVPRTAREIAQAASVPVNQLYAALDAVVENVGSRVLPAGPTAILPRIASDAAIPPPVETTAAQILRDAQARTTGRRPEPMAAAALLLAARRLGEDASATKLAQAAGVSRQSLYMALRELESNNELACHAT